MKKFFCIRIWLRIIFKNVLFILKGYVIKSFIFFGVSVLDEFKGWEVDGFDMLGLDWVDDGWKIKMLRK